MTDNVDVSAPTIEVDSSRPAIATILGLDESEHVELPETVAGMAQSGRTKPGGANTAGASSRSSGRRAAVARTGSTLNLPSDTPKKSAIARFLEEAQVTGQLEHPNIVPVHEVGVDDKARLFFTMKLVRGESLKERLEHLRGRVMRGGSDDSFSLHERIDVFRKICDAIAFAHSRGVIHRDLKPENVMLGEFGEVQVMDWGIARVTGRADRSGGEAVISDRVEEGIARTMDGAVAGTPAYMSPEQARGEIAKIDQRSDVFSLGAILYEMVTFTAPYRGESVWKVLDKAKKGVVQPPSDRVAHEYGNIRGAQTGRRNAGESRISTGGPQAIPRELEAVVMKAMARNAKERYRNVREFRNDLDAWVEGRTLRAADYSTWQLFSKWVQRNKAAAIGTAATLIVAISGVVALFAMSAANERQRTEDVAAAAVEAADQTRKDEAARALADQEAAAESLWTDGQKLLAEADTHPFSESAPQDYFFFMLPATRLLGRALQAHPQPPPGWKQQLAELCATVQEHCEIVGDYALGQHVAGSAYDWGAISENEVATRLNHVDQVRRQQIDADRQRLQAVLSRIRAAESGNSGVPDDNQRLVPGELDERARQVAAVGGTDVTRELMTAVVADLNARRDGRANATNATNGAGTIGMLERRLSINALALRGDIQIEVDGRTLPDYARSILSSPPAFVMTDELLDWLWLAARLQVRHRCFGDMMTVRHLLPPDYANAGSGWAQEIATIHQWMDVASGRRGSILPVPSTQPGEVLLDNPEYLHMLGALAEFVAGSARSGAEYTRLLLSMAASGKAPDGRTLTTRERMFVIDQLGLYGDARPPDPDRPEVAAVAVLRQAVEGLPDEWLDSRQPMGVDRDVWMARRALALTAALNLARLNDTDSAVMLYRKRVRAPQHGEFYNRMRLPVELLPPDPAAVAAMDLNDPSPFSGDNPELERLLSEGKANRDSGNYAVADRLFTQALAIDPSNQTALAGRGFARMLMNELAGAKADYDEAIRLAPGSASLYVARASVHVRLRDYRQAMADYDQALQLDPRQKEALVNRSTLRGNLGDFTGAIADANAALKVDPLIPQAWKNLAVCYVQLSDRTADPVEKRRLLDSALNAFDNVLRSQPDSPTAWADRGATRMRLRDFAGAVADLDRAIRIHYMMRAQLHDALAKEAGDGTPEFTAETERAILDYTKVIELQPRNVDVRSNRAALYLNLNKLDEAEEDLKAALSMDNRNYRAWMYYGIVRGIRTDRAGSHQAFDSARANAPANMVQAIEAYRQRYAGPR